MRGGAGPSGWLIGGRALVAWPIARRGDQGEHEWWPLGCQRRPVIGIAQGANDGGIFMGRRRCCATSRTSALTSVATASACPINNYRNNSYAKGKAGSTADALTVKDALLQAAGSKTALGAAGGGSAYVGVFTGKGTPATIAKVLPLFYEHRENFKCSRKPEGRRVPLPATWPIQPCRGRTRCRESATT